MAKRKPGQPINRFCVQLVFEDYTVEYKNEVPDMTPAQVIAHLEKFVAQWREVANRVES